MRRGEWHDNARRLRADGLNYTEIGRRLGVTTSAVSKALNPDRRREYNRRDLARPGRKQQQRSSDRRWRATPEIRGECANPCCDSLRGVGATLRRATGHCESCFHAIATVRRTLAEGMWADGWSLKAMAEAFGVGENYFTVMRAQRDWDLPYRYRVDENGRRLPNAA